MAGREERVGRRVGEGQPTGVCEDERRACGRGLRTRLGEHLGSQVGGDGDAVRADGLAEGGQRRPVPQPTSTTTPPRGMPAWATAAA